MEQIGGEGEWRVCALEVDLQRIDLMDLEQSKNLWHKVIHMLWVGLSLSENHRWTKRIGTRIVRSG